MAGEAHTRRRPSRHSSLLDRSREAFASRGLTGTLRLAAGYARQLAFDLRNGVDTRGTLYHLQEDGSWRYARAYQPVGGRSFARPLAELDIDRSAFTFVDLGCGKGKALLLAARAGFGRVVGVELSEPLAAVARANAAARRADAAVEVVVGDVTDFEFPPDPLVVFDYHAFDEPVLRAVLANLERSLRAQPREAYFVYVSPQLAAAVDAAPGLVRRAAGPDYVVYAARRAD